MIAGGAVIGYSTQYDIPLSWAMADKTSLLNALEQRWHGVLKEQLDLEDRNKFLKMFLESFQEPPYRQISAVPRVGKRGRE